MKYSTRWLIGVLLAVALVVALGLIVTGGRGSLAADGFIYVDADATGANNGSSWADAFTDLQSALDAVPLSGDQIWVAEGTYTPTLEFSPGDARSATFQMENGVAIYGGFDPSVGDVAWGDRDWVTHEAILSGDLDGDDGPNFANSDENSYHVFYHPDGTDLDASAILDGFTISGGNADGPPYDDIHGGGMFNNGSSPTLNNCTFTKNLAYAGGGMANVAVSDPALANCIFSGNSADALGGYGGGGMFNDSSDPELTNCAFTDNSARYGGGMHNESYADPRLIDCTFTDNSAADGGGMANFDEASPTLLNCTFSGNSALVCGGGMYNVDDSSSTLTNCTFWDNSAEFYFGGGMVSNNWSTLTNCILWGDSPDEIWHGFIPPPVTYSDVQGGYTGTGNIDEDPLFVDPASGDFHLSLDSPCIDVGDNAAPDLPLYDFEGDDRTLDGDGNVMATVDMGVDEVAVDWPHLRVYLPLVLR